MYSCNNVVFNLIGSVATQNCHSEINIIGLNEYCWANNNKNFYNLIYSQQYQCAQLTQSIVVQMKHVEMGIL